MTPFIIAAIYVFAQETEIPVLLGLSMWGGFEAKGETRSLWEARDFQIRSH